jgi:glutathione peroxidase
MRLLIANFFTTLLMLLAPEAARARDSASTNAWSFAFTAIDGKPMPLSDFQGKVLLVVNVASFCGFTPQYKALQSLYEKYEAKGLVIIGVPSNDFGAQEPKGEGEIKAFCEGIYGVMFPLTEKEVVSGDGAHPFYRWARQELGWLNAPKWNFHKYLVGRDGRLVTSFFSVTAPDSERLVSAVETELAKPYAPMSRAPAPKTQ